MRVIAGAPEELRPLLVRAYRARDGVRVAVDGGPTLRFGAPIRLAAKWASAARVLADTPAAGAASRSTCGSPSGPSAAYDAGDSAAEAVTTQESQVQAATAAVTRRTGHDVRPRPARRAHRGRGRAPVAS